MSDDHLSNVLTRGRKAAERDEGRELPPESNLPDPSRGYEPYSRPSNKPLYTLHCVLGRDGYRSFQYVHLDSDGSLSVDERGHVVQLRFCGSKTMAVTIRGRNLWRLYDYLHQHRIAWVMRVDRGRDFAQDSEPVVNSIDIEEVRPPAAGE